MRIAFFGLPLAALLLAGDGHDVVYAALCRPGSLGERRLRRRVGTSLVDVKPDVAAPGFVARLREARPDILVSWFWTTRLPQAVLSVAPLGAFGVHPSLLPRHRGPDPYFWAIDSGDEVTGVTAHRLEEDYDTGAILQTREVPIERAWNSWTLARRLDRPSLALLRDVARAFAEGRPPSPVSQDETAATLAPLPSDSELEIDWTWDAARIARRVRAASPLPGAYTFLGDAEVTLTRAAPTRNFPRALAPGEAAVTGVLNSEVAVVRAGDIAVALLEGAVEDAATGELRQLNARALAALVRDVAATSAT